MNVFEARKLAEMRRQRKVRDLASDIGEIPEVKNPERKALCRV